jgi:hypothetical protein
VSGAFLFVFIFFVRFSHTVRERIFIILLVVFYTFFAVAISFAVFPTAFTDLIFQSVHFLRIVYVLVTSIIQSRNVLTQQRYLSSMLSILFIASCRERSVSSGLLMPIR